VGTQPGARDKTKLGIAVMEEVLGILSMILAE